MGKRLYVGGLAWATDDNALKEAFSKFGEVVDHKVITDRETGRSRGFGFVTYETEEQAEAAIAEMNGSELDGRRLMVNEARERQSREGGGGGGFRGGGGGGGYRGGGGGPGGGGGFGGGAPDTDGWGVKPGRDDRGGKGGGRRRRGRRDDGWGGDDW